MSRSLHLAPIKAPGPGVQPDAWHLPFSGISGESPAYPCPSRVACRLHPNVTTLAFKFASESTNFVCKVRRKPGFPDQSGHSFYPPNGDSREDWEENPQYFKDDDMLSSKNGSLPSQSKTQKLQPTASPGPREKEIVEVMRKARLQLQQRASNKADNEVKVDQEQGSADDPMDAIFQVLRKHAKDGSQRNNGSDKGNRFPEEAKKNVKLKGESIAKPSGFDGSLKDEPQKSDLPSDMEPASNFQRRTPFAHVKYRPIPSIGESIENSTLPRQTGGEKMGRIEVQTAHDSSAHSTPDPVIDTHPEPEHASPRDLSRLRMPELRDIAKSRGLKGVSKLQKSALLELLDGSSG